MKAFKALLMNELRSLARDKMMLFFTLLFPLVFVLLFGFLMGGIGDVDQATLGLVVQADAEDAILADSLSQGGLSSIQRLESRRQLEASVGDHDVDFGLIWDGVELRFVYDPSRLQENYAYQQLAAGIVADFNIRRQGARSSIEVVRIQAGEIESTGWFNLVLPGILAFTILSSGLFAISGHLTEMKQRNILDRMMVTPMPPTALLAAIAIVRLAIGFISTLITLSVGIFVFDLSFTVDWFRYSVFVICATLGTMGLGTVIALLVRRPSSAGNVANALAMVMMFTAGIYFPVEFMPAFLRTISSFMPLSHMANAMRYVTGVLDMSDVRFWITSASFLGLAIILFPLMARYIVRPIRR